MGRQRPAEPVELVGDLLVVVEDPGDVAARGCQGRGQVQADGDTALHVDAAAAPHDRLPVALLQAARDVAGAPRDRDGVEVPGDDDPLGAPQTGAGDDGVAVPQDLQVIPGRQGRLDGVRQRGLGAGDARHVHQGQGERPRVAGRVGQHDRAGDGAAGRLV